jgi:hypothetical protein
MKNFAICSRFLAAEMAALFIGPLGGPHFVPLTPALSLRESENPPLAFRTTHRGVCPTILPKNRTCGRLFPLPEGQGEGTRVAVQHSDSDHFRKSSPFASPQPQPDVFQFNDSAPLTAHCNRRGGLL